MSLHDFHTMFAARVSNQLLALRFSLLRMHLFPASVGTELRKHPLLEGRAR
jgi:hypothetical protein